MRNEEFFIALPNKGRLKEKTIDFFNKCGLTVNQDNERQYQTTMLGIEGDVNIIFQRVRDIPRLIKDGKADLAITGFDVLCESAGSDDEEDSPIIPVFPDRIKKKSPDETDNNPPIEGLPYGQCDLVIAVPEHWTDTSSIHDLADLALQWKKDGKRLNVATEFPSQTRRFLLNKGINYVKIIEVYGAAESAPRMGMAEFVSDLRSSGTTLKENRLKVLNDGVILNSSACLIASKQRLCVDGKIGEKKRQIAKEIIGRIEAHLLAKKYYLVTANVEVKPEDGKKDLEVLRGKLLEDLDDCQLNLLGQQGPTIAEVLILKEKQGKGPKHYSISVQIKSRDLEKVVDILRDKTGRDILVSPLNFVYDSESAAYHVLCKKLKKKRKRK